MSLESNKSVQIAKNTILLYLRLIVVMIVGFITSRVILRNLGVEDFGIYNLVGGIVILFSFLQNALTNATYRFFAYDLGKKDFKNLSKTFSMSINAHLILSVFILALCEIIGTWLLNSKLNIPEERMVAANIVFQFSILSFCINVIKTPYNSAIIVHEHMNFYALISIIESLLKLSLVYLLVVFNSDKLIIYSLLLFLLALLMLILNIIYSKKKFKECTYKKCWDKKLLIKLLKFSGLSSIVNLADVAVTQSIVFLFNIFYGVVANAALGLANQVNTLVCSFISSFTQAFNPQMIKSYANNERDYFMMLLFSTSKLSYYFMYVIVVPVLVNSEYLLDLWLEEVPSDTAVFLLYSLIYSIFDSFSAPLWNAVTATGNIKTHQLLMSGIKILNIPLAYIALRLGLPACSALAIKAFLNFVCSIVRPLYMKSLINLNFEAYFKKVLLKLMIVTIFTLPVPILISIFVDNSIIKLLLSTFSFIIVFIVTLFYYGLDTREKQLLLKIIKK